MIGRKMFGILICLLLMVTVLPHGTFTVDANYVSENYDLLILTYNEDFKNAFKPLQQYHNNTGVPTVIKTVDDVESEQGGRGPREIQGFIQDAHNNWGVNYVLLGGDTDFIPVRYLYVSGLPPPYSTLEIPADMYYGCFGTWNGDGDSRYGEVEDNVDFTPSVYVGRACVDNTEDINNFVQKTIDYLENSVNQQLYLRDILGVGEYLGFEPGSTDYGAYFVDDILSMLPTDGGYNYDVTKLYERDGNWGTEDLMREINEGINFLIHMGHGKEDKTMKMTEGDCLKLTNSGKPFFLSSEACSIGWFDWEKGDCWAEFMGPKNPNGAFALVVNSRESPNLADDSVDAFECHRLSKHFWFYAGEGVPLGKALMEAKYDLWDEAKNNTCMRVNIYELNLLGDPNCFPGIGSSQATGDHKHVC